MSVLESFSDEIQKIAVRLNEEEQRRQALQFAGVGAASVPVISAVGNIIEHGKIIPPGASPARWLARQGATGGLLFGAVPAVRSRIEQDVQGEASERLRRQRISQALKEHHARVG